MIWHVIQVGYLLLSCSAIVIMAAVICDRGMTIKEMQWELDDAEASAWRVRGLPPGTLLDIDLKNKKAPAAVATGAFLS